MVHGKVLVPNGLGTLAAQLLYDEYAELYSESVSVANGCVMSPLN